VGWVFAVCGVGGSGGGVETFALVDIVKERRGAVLDPGDDAADADFDLPWFWTVDGAQHVGSGGEGRCEVV
jgi:hypothetical protein